MSAGPPTATASPQATVFWLDGNDVIVRVGEGWDDFARENDARGIDARHVIGRNLLDFIEGDATRMYVRTLIQSARLLRRPLQRNYRCDSPDSKRFMEMQLIMEASGLLRFEHRTVGIEPMRQPVRFRLAPGATARPGPCLVRCSICNQVKGPGGWVEPDALVPAQDVVADPGDWPVIYGVCPRCIADPGKVLGKRLKRS